MCAAPKPHPPAGPSLPPLPSGKSKMTPILVPRLRYAFLLAAAVLLGLGPIAADEIQAIDFQKQIQPILAKKCFACHGPDEAESGLSFTSREAALAETESGSLRSFRVTWKPVR